MRYLLFVLALTAPLGAQTATRTFDGWTAEEVGVGVVLRSASLVVAGLPQTVALLEIQPTKTGARLALRCPGGFLELQELAPPTGAVAAINGGFFAPDGRSVGVLRVDGQDHGGVHVHRTTALVLDQRDRVAIETDATGVFEGRRDVMSAGPLLVRDGEVSSHATGWSTARHPRTAIGLRTDGAILMLAVDGRTPESRGLSLVELAGLMRELGCRDALNLDGGGSTTMWVRGEAEGGIVNFPCDNRRHDRVGVRKIPNAIVVLARDVIVEDEDEAVLAPESDWARRTDGGDPYGGDWAASSTPGATATWTLDADFAGAWELQIRCPRVADLTPSARVRCAALDVRFDQKAHGGRWRTLGRIRLAEPGEVTITLSSEDERTLAVDAIRLVQAP